MRFGFLIAATPLVLAFIAFKVARGMPVRTGLIWALVGVYALWAGDLLFSPLLVDARLRAAAVAEARSYTGWINIIPMSTVLDQLGSPSGAARRQLWGNLGLLLPLGLLGPALSTRLRTGGNVLRAALACALAIELVQLVGTVSGFIQRSVDIDDVLVNVAGAVLGYAIWKVTGPRKQNRPESQ